MLQLNGHARPRLFANDRPVVLYNPHFDPKLSSWGAEAKQVIRRIVDDLIPACCPPTWRDLAGVNEGRRAADLSPAVFRAAV